VARFLILTQYFPPEIGAAQIRLDEVSRVLRESGHMVDVVTAMPNFPTGRVFPAYRGKLLVREEIGGQRVIRTWIYAAAGGGAVRRLASYWSFVCSSLVGCLLVPRPDVVLVESPPIFLGLTAYLFCRLTGARYIVNVSDLWLEVARDIGFVRSPLIFAAVEHLEMFIYRHAARVNAVTETIRALLVERKGVPRQKVLWLPNGVNLERFREVAADQRWRDQLGLNGRTVFIYAGSHQPSHGLDVLLEAAALLDGSIAMVLVGDGTEKERLVRAARARGLSNVCFVDPQPIDEIPGLLSLARAAVVSVRGEKTFSSTRPAKLFPAMACGKPIVYCGRGEGAALVRDAECGLVVPPGDAPALAAALRRLATDTQLAQALGLNGRRLVERTFDWRAIVSQWLGELGLDART
jgi:glycosyltransferase involved in cell wall biosynthesis